ncbi:glycosyltransferase family 2 protein [Candidatus Woesearchaeota archaeon]|nr:glycosyltransferase family 2 protein [Candidatus Woesearchaeota archaeon]
MNAKPKSLSVLIPCYNEEDNIAECIKRIPSMPWKYEVIVIDDGSKDDTAKIARYAKRNNPNLKVVSYKPNHGKGYAIRKGMENAKGDVAIILDADMATQPEEIPLVVKPIFDGNADFVNGSRLIYPMEKGAMKLLHIPGNKIFALLVSMIAGKKLTDSLCGFKAFKIKPFLGKLKEDSWPDFELLIKAKRFGMKIEEIPIHYKPRIAGVSKMKTFRHGYKMLKMLIRGLKKNY